MIDQNKKKKANDHWEKEGMENSDHWLYAE